MGFSLDCGVHPPKPWTAWIAVGVRWPVGARDCHGASALWCLQMMLERPRESSVVLGPGSNRSPAFCFREYIYITVCPIFVSTHTCEHIHTRTHTNTHTHAHFGHTTEPVFFLPGGAWTPDSQEAHGLSPESLWSPGTSGCGLGVVHKM